MTDAEVQTKGELRAELRRLAKRKGATVGEFAGVYVAMLDAPREVRERVPLARPEELRGGGVQSF